VEKEKDLDIDQGSIRLRYRYMPQCGIIREQREQDLTNTGGRKMRRLLIILGSIAFVAFLAMPLLAHTLGWERGQSMMGYWGDDPGCCWRVGRGYDNLTKEQRSQVDTLHQEFHDGAALLESQIAAKRAELNALLTPLGTVDIDRALALRKDISELRAKLAQEQSTFELEMRKLAPEGPYAREYARSCCWHMGGYGAGRWWN
jgi:Spy/CpxP family protein refolding chaperone